MSDPALERFTQAAERLAGVKHALEEMRSAWPTSGEFEGADETGAFTVVLAASGNVTAVRLASDWRQRLEIREFVRALNQARGQAMVKLTQLWVDDVVEDEIEVTPRSHTRRRVTLDEYRARQPELHSLEDLSAKFELAAAARAEYTRYTAAIGSLARRERFRSPAGLFDAVRTRAEIVLLEAEPASLTFRSDDEIARDIVATIAEARRLDEAEEAQLQAEFPALAELRAARVNSPL